MIDQIEYAEVEIKEAQKEMPRSRLLVKMGEREYILECDSKAPLGEVHDALHQYLRFILDKMEEAAKRPAVSSEESICPMEDSDG